MAPPTVLHVLPSLSTGGAEQMLAALVTAKRSRRPVSAAVAVLIGGGDLTQSIRASGVPVYDLGMTHWMQLPMALLRLVALIRQIRPAAIQSWLYYADLISLWALDISGRRATTRLYWGVRCSDMDQSKYQRGLRWAIAACVSRSARPDAVVANSFAGRDAHLRLGYAPRAFPVVANGIDTHRFRPNADLRAFIRKELGLIDMQLLVIHVARLDPMKDHDSLLKVAAEFPEIRFLAVGSGTESLAGPPNLIKLGKRTSLPPLYAAADIALSTSAFGEGFPNVIAEAMAAGLPVVATDVGDSRRIVGDTGLVVPPRNASAIAAALRKLVLESPEARRQRGTQARERIEGSFSLDRAVAAFDALHLDGIWPPEPAAGPHAHPAI
jgi:glycosyltransferase involved in cell wall biosynthesis